MTEEQRVRERRTSTSAHVDMRAQMDQLKREIQERNAEIERLETSLQGMRSRYSVVPSLNTLSTRLFEHRQRSQQLHGSISARNGIVSGEPAVKSLASSSQVIETLNAEIDSLKLQCQNYQQALLTEREARKELNNRNLSLQETVDRLDLERRNFEGIRLRQERMNKEEISRRRKAESLTDKLTKEKNEYGKEMANWESKYKNALQQFEMEQKRVEQLVIAYETVKKAYDDKFAKERQEIVKLSSSIDNIQKMRAQDKQFIDEALSAYASLLQQYEMSKADLQKSTVDVSRQVDLQAQKFKSKISQLETDVKTSRKDTEWLEKNSQGILQELGRITSKLNILH